MAAVSAPLSVRVRAAGRGVVIFSQSPRYVALWLATSVLGYALINALLDIQLLWTLATLNVAPSIRLEAISDVLFSPSGLPLANIISTVLLAILFGYVLSASIFAARKLQVQADKSGSLGLLTGVIGSGCAACGTSLLAPLLTAIGITTTAAALSFAFYINLLGIALLLFAAFKVSAVNASYQKT